jgi:hypothetical protein
MWTTELQLTFETLRSKVAISIYLVHPDEEKSLIINTHESGKAIGSVLMQQDENGDSNIISTASGVLKSAEQRYTTLQLSMLYSVSRFIFMGARLSYIQIIKLLISFINVSLHPTV